MTEFSNKFENIGGQIIYYIFVHSIGILYILNKELYFLHDIPFVKHSDFIHTLLRDLSYKVLLLYIIIVHLSIASIKHNVFVTIYKFSSNA